MGTVTTIPEKCKRCYTCVRECPAKAIKVQNGQAFVIEDRCIACGNCVKVCAQNAKQIRDSVEDVRSLLSGNEPVFACLAPSFPAAFHETEPERVIGAIRALGFDEVWSVAFGAELVSKAYAKLFEESRETGKVYIATPCPAVVAYIEKYMPALHGLLAPIVSPMIAIARAIRKNHGDRVKVVFIGPCIAKKEEILEPFLMGDVDDVLTFKELQTMIEESGLSLCEVPPSDFDGPKSYLGRSFPISGGLLKTAGISTDILDNDVVTTEGKDRVLAALEELESGHEHAHFFDLLFCEGCINGPRMLNELGMLARRELLSRFVQEQNRKVNLETFRRSLDEYSDVNLHREFLLQDLPLVLPSEEDITAALAQMRKTTPADHLNCGACGYPTCRENAIAVCQGLAEPGMCLPFLVEELEDLLGELQESNQELASTQQKLVQTERLASMGQLSAGVAHELNNPLGTVLIYSHMILRHLPEDDSRREDLQMIVSEANRCKTIVRGLLDFARQSRVSKAPAQLGALISEVIAIMNSRAETAGVRISWDNRNGLPPMMIDSAQIKQVLVNLVGNAIDATPSGGEVTVRSRMIQGDGAVEISVSDTGQGIPSEHLDKLFTPFFTTKELGKGTGLGLAIAYGIVKMHSGNIWAESEPGKGSTFTVTLPVTEPESTEAQAINSIKTQD